MTLEWTPVGDTDPPTVTATGDDQTYVITPVQSGDGIAFGLGYGDGVIRWQYPDLETAEAAAEEQSSKTSRAQAWQRYMEQNDPPESGG